MFSAIFINMNKSAILKLDKLIQEILIEETDPNSPFYVKPKPSLEDLGIYPNYMSIGPSDRLTKANYTTLGTKARVDAAAAWLQSYKTDPFGAKEKDVAAADQRAAKAIAKTIYDGKGVFWDDEASVIKVIGKIKNSKQYDNVKTEFKIISGGKDLVTYIRSFTTIMDRLAIVYVLKDIISIPTLKTIVTYGDYKTATYITPSISDKHDIGTPTAAGSNMLTLMTTNPTAWYGAQKTADDANTTFADFWHMFSGDYDPWMETHSTWDTFINGANGKQDGIRSEVYSVEGLITTTITSMLPGPSKVLTSIFFGLLVADDIIRLQSKKNDIWVWVDLLFDLMGVFAGPVAASGRSMLKPIGQLLVKFASGVKGKALIPFIEAVQRVAGSFGATKFGQMLKKLGSGIGTAITSIINTFINNLVSMLNTITKTFPSLASWCKQIINVISGIGSVIGRLVSGIWTSLKILWWIISAPAKSASWIIQKLTPGTKEVKLAFGTGGKVGVYAAGFYYIILPEIRDLINPEIPNPMELTAVNAITMLNSVQTGLTKIPPGEITCYERDDAGKMTAVGVYEQIYIDVEGKDIPLICEMHTETIKGNWIQIGITPSVEDYQIGNVNQTLYWVDIRQLVIVNKQSLKKYIIKNSSKTND